MNPVVAVITFGILLLAELPDKSMFASLVLGTRFSPRWVFLGVAAAFAVHVVIAVSVGSLLALAPRHFVRLAVALLFFAGAALMLFAAGSHDESQEEADASSLKSSWGVAAASFGVIFVGEWGDITQIAMANLAARYDDALAVGIGATLALWTAALLAISVGKNLLRFVSVPVLHRIGAVVFVGFGIASLIEALR